MSFVADHFNVAGASSGPKPAKSPAGTSAAPHDQWAIIEPALFIGEDVLFIIDPTCLREARAAHPGLVTYLTSEIDLLWPFRDNKDFIKRIHLVKKHLGGWLREVRPRLLTL